MRRNVEIKARVNDEDSFARLARSLSGRDPEVIHQDDVFFCISEGRLKLRRLSPDRGELIFYRRDDKAGPKTSNYSIAVTAEPEAMVATLGAALGIRGEVIKTRRLYMAGRTRIHLDNVEGLGVFMELEVVLDENESAVAGHGEALELMKTLGVLEDDLVQSAYIDLLEEA